MFANGYPITDTSGETTFVTLTSLYFYTVPPAVAKAEEQTFSIKIFCFPFALDFSIALRPRLSPCPND